MHFVLLEVYPLPVHPGYSEVGGAYVSVFVRDGTPEAAEVTAQQFVADAGWRVAGVEDSHAVSLASYATDDDNREHFKQAESDGVVAIFHQWPTTAPDHWDDPD